MNIGLAIFLGVVQGITEFLPISSSGHLVFFQSLLGMKEPQLFLDVMLHLGTLVSVVVYFRADITGMMHDIFSRARGRGEALNGSRLFVWIVLSTLPTGLMGVILHDWFKSLFSKPGIVGVMLLVTGLVLWLTRWAPKEGRSVDRMGWKDSILIGIAQGMAIIPGISRAGSTISVGLFLGLDRELSGRFSFLLSVPAILGATLLELRKVESGIEIWPSLVGMTIAFIVGLFSLKFLMKIIKMGKISNFSYYCWAIGIIIIAVNALNP